MTSIKPTGLVRGSRIQHGAGDGCDRHRAGDRSGVSRVELLINGKVVARDTVSAYRFSSETGKYGKRLKIALRAYDNAGNVTTTSERTWYR